jgi:hypothetical protein
VVHLQPSTMAATKPMISPVAGIGDPGTHEGMGIDPKKIQIHSIQFH